MTILECAHETIREHGFDPEDKMVEQIVLHAANAILDTVFAFVVNVEPKLFALGSKMSASRASIIGMQIILKKFASDNDLTTAITNIEATNAQLRAKMEKTT